MNEPRKEQPTITYTISDKAKKSALNRLGLKSGKGRNLLMAMVHFDWIGKSTFWSRNIS